VLSFYRVLDRFGTGFCSFFRMIPDIGMSLDQKEKDLIYFTGMDFAVLNRIRSSF
jgi:hypothetical protein